jgi:hypothetical protein
MDAATFDQLQATLKSDGPAPAIDRLCGLLREGKDYGSLFYALLMKKRYQLGVSPFPTGPSQDLPETAHEEYENSIREAARLVGGLYLAESNIPHAWVYYRMLGEPAAVAEALEKVQPGEGEDCQPLVDIALHQGVHPRKGFDLVLERYGLCSAITTAGNLDPAHTSEVREYCVRRLVHALYAELAERLAGEILRHDGQAPSSRSVRELMAGRDWLFDDEFAHIDVSHLSSVVQMSVHLTRGPEMDLARELCAYGQRLPARFHGNTDPPFEDPYRDYGVFLSVLAGDNVEEGIAHFRRKADEADPETIGSYPAEVLVNLLLRLDRDAEAFEVARKHLAFADGRPLTCPSVAELCQRTGNYRTLAEVAREQGDPVHFVAGLIAAEKAACGLATRSC